ncbi:MAG: NAD-dependent epimerase/dehydratase family protein [Rickettsiales bacterium]
MKKNHIKYLITGSSGWIAKSFLAKLKLLYSDDFENIVLPLSSKNHNLCLNKNLIKTFKYNHNFDQNFEYHLIHLGYPSKNVILELGAENFENQCIKNREFIEYFCNNYKVKSLIFSSSGTVYTQTDQYAKNKIFDEEYLQNLAKKHNLNLLITRIFNIGGPYVNKPENFALYNFLLQARSHKNIRIEAKNDIYRSFVHLENLSDFFYCWLNDHNKNSHEILDICTDKSIELKDLAKKIIKIFNLNCEIISPNYNIENHPEFYIGNAKKYYDFMQKYQIKIHDLNKIITDSNDYLNIISKL